GMATVFPGPAYQRALRVHTDPGPGRHRPFNQRLQPGGHVFFRAHEVAVRGCCHAREVAVQDRSRISMRSMRTQIAAALACAWACGAVLAQDLPSPEYEVKQEDPTIGSNIKRRNLRDSAVALNLPDHQLPEDEKQVVNSWWASLAPGDEPPFPADGLRSILDPMGNAQRKLGQSGTLKAIAVVGQDGTV